MTMTIGEILTALEPATADTQVYFAFGGVSPTTIGCYRGYYDEAAIGFTDGQYGSDIQTVKGLRDELKRASRKGVRHTAWKGGEYQFTKDTPLHVDNPGNCTDTDIVRVEVQEYRVVIHTAQEAPLDGADVNFGQRPFVYDPPGGYTPALKGAELLTQPCLFHNVNPQANPVMGLACPCPRCSPR